MTDALQTQRRRRAPPSTVTHVAFGKCAVAFAPSHAHREVVLSIAKLAAGQQSYYLNSVAERTEEHYLGAREAAAHWVAWSQSSLGLVGEFVASVLHAVLEVRPPRTGEPLGRAQRRLP